MATYNSLTDSSRSVSLVTHYNPVVFQWCVTPILPEDLFGIFHRQFYHIKSYIHQNKDVTLTSNTVRFYMQIISLNIRWSKGIPTEIFQEFFQGVIDTVPASSLIRLVQCARIFSHLTWHLKLNSVLDSASSYELRNNVIKQDDSRLGRVVCFCKYLQTSQVKIT
jgi:hypothetical protein